MDPDGTRGSSAFVLGGSVLEPELDAELSNIAAEAARIVDVPVTVVTINLDRGRAFRARYQLATEAMVARGSDRDVALCDLVAMTGPLEVGDVAAEAAVPREAADCPGLRACLCVPISIAGAAVGGLCAIDLTARSFTDEHRAGLARLADRAGRRAAAIAAERRARALVLVQRTTAPVLGELRAMMALVGGENAERLSRVVEALDAALDGGRGPVTLAEVTAAAESLAYATTARVGGVRWSFTSDAPLAVAPALASAAVSAALSAVADRVAAAGSVRGLVAAARIEGGVGRVAITADVLDAAAAAACAAEVLHALGGDPQVAVTGEGAQLVVRLPRLVEPAPSEVS